MDPAQEYQDWADSPDQTEEPAAQDTPKGFTPGATIPLKTPMH